MGRGVYCVERYNNNNNNDNNKNVLSIAEVYTNRSHDILTQNNHRKVSDKQRNCKV
jgi:hypothetical protein